ncbi:MAG: mitofilin family membrane protein [Thalassobaculaceae bacterium]
MAETPKSGNETDANESGASESGAGARDSLEGGAASPADDALETGPGGGDDGLSADSLSGGASSDHIEGGEGRDSLSDGESDAAPASPWSSASSASGATSAGETSTDASAANETPDPAPVRPAKSGGGIGRLVVFLILVVLIAGAGYATYPQWRDDAQPYAEMVGFSLPPVPGAPAEVADGSTDTAPAAPAVSVPDTTQPQESADASEPSRTEPSPPAASSVSTTEFEALAERVSAAEAEIERLSAAPAPSAADPALMDRIDALEGKLTALGDEMAIVREGLGTADDTDGVSEVASSLTDRLADLDARLSALEQRPETPAVSPQDLTGLSDRLEAAAQAAREGDAEIAARLDALAAAQADLSERLSQGRDVQEKAGAFLLASNLLAAASSGSGGFSAELDAVAAAALDQPEVATAIATLRDHAGGVPSTADLRSRFPSVAASVIDASIVGADEGVIGTALTRIASLVTLRRTETDDGDAIDAIVNRAEAAANAGDLPAAVEALSALDGDPATVAAPWIAEAQARIAVNGAVRTLQSRALATLSGS